MWRSRWSGRAVLLLNRRNGGNVGVWVRGFAPDRGARKANAMRAMAALTCVVLVSCTSGGFTGADGPSVLVEVPRPGVDPYAADPVGGYGYTSTADDAVVARPAATTPLDDDRLNLMEYTLAQQKIDAAAAERQLAQARSQLVIVQPESLPDRVDGVNIALFAQQTDNAVGERRYDRGIGGGFGGSCGRYPTSDAAQRAFLASGGPQSDSLGLDRDGDGFACAWDPVPYRQLRL